MVKSQIKGPCGILEEVFVTKIGGFQLLVIVTGDLVLDATILVIIFWDFLMFYQIFLSPQVKRIVIISSKYGIRVAERHKT